MDAHQYWSTHEQAHIPLSPPLSLCPSAVHRDGQPCAPLPHLAAGLVACACQCCQHLRCRQRQRGPAVLDRAPGATCGSPAGALPRPGKYCPFPPDGAHWAFVCASVRSLRGSTMSTAPQARARCLRPTCHRSACATSALCPRLCPRLPVATRSTCANGLGGTNLSFLQGRAIGCQGFGFHRCSNAVCSKHETSRFDN